MDIVPGKTRTDAQITLYVRGDSPVTLLQAQSVGGGPALRPLGAQVMGPGRRRHPGNGFFRYPPTAAQVGGRAMRVPGAVLRPGGSAARHGYLLLLGYRFGPETFSVRTSVRLTYEVGGERLVQVLPVGLMACPLSQTQDACMDRGERIVVNAR